MSKIAQYLQEHLLGEVSASPDIRRALAHDSSVLRLVPAAAVYPRDESDVRKAVRFCWQLTERGRALSVTVRGAGSDTSGGALSDGLTLLTTTHLNRILELNQKKRLLIVEPGISFDKLHQTLITHGVFLGFAPANGFATVGGAIAANTPGERSLKYGDARAHVQSLRVVLANGEVIETGPISKRELNRKMGLSNFEGQIYRAIDKLLEENQQTVTSLGQAAQAINHGVGYRLDLVQSDTGLNLTPLFIGSQGALGIITEARLKVDVHNPLTTLALVSLNNTEDLAGLLPQILKLKPSLCDFMTGSAVSAVNRLNPAQLTGALDVSNAAIHLLIEFDDVKAAARHKKLKALGKLVEGIGAYITSSDEEIDQQRLWKLRQSVATIMLHAEGPKRPVPVADNLSVPPANLAAFIKQAGHIFSAERVSGPMWGQAGSGTLHCFVHLDLAEVGDRQRYFKLSESLYNAAISQGGSLSASGEGRVGAPYVGQLYGDEFVNLMRQVKNIFDPHGILNSGVKATSQEELIAMLRTDYSLARHHEHLPRS